MGAGAASLYPQTAIGATQLPVDCQRRRHGESLVSDVLMRPHRRMSMMGSLQQVRSLLQQDYNHRMLDATWCDDMNVLQCASAI